MDRKEEKIFFLHSQAAHSEWKGCSLGLLPICETWVTFYVVALTCLYLSMYDK